MYLWGSRRWLILIKIQGTCQVDQNIAKIMGAVTITVLNDKIKNKFAIYSSKII